MTNVKRCAISAMTLGALFLIGSLLRSRDSQAKGAYSTPVTVMNTTSQPALGADVEKLARVPYDASITNNSCSSSCVFTFPDPPPGYRLVVENISGYFLVTPTSAAPTGRLLDTGNVTWMGFSAPVGSATPFSGTQATFNQPAKIYHDLGQGSLFAVVWASFAGTANQMILAGYLENCSITGCPAIQH